MWKRKIRVGREREEGSSEPDRRPLKRHLAFLRTPVPVLAGKHHSECAPLVLMKPKRLGKFFSSIYFVFELIDLLLYLYSDVFLGAIVKQVIGTSMAHC